MWSAVWLDARTVDVKAWHLAATMVLNSVEMLDESLAVCSDVPKAAKNDIITFSA